MRTKPLISVAMPFYNSARTIGDAIQSVLNQTYENLEIIAIDDGSSDGSAAIVSQFSDPRIRLYRNACNSGAGFTRNRCLDLMRGEFMAPMDADDTCHPKRLEWTLAALQEKPEFGICGGWMRVRGGGFFPYVYRVPCSREAVNAAYLFTNPYLNGTIMIRRSIIDRYGIRYDEHRRGGEDYGFGYRVVKHSGGINIPRTLLYYFQNPKGLTAKTQAITIEQRTGLIQPQLERLFARVLTADELRYHVQIGNGAGATSLDDLRSIAKWLDTILRSNQRMRVYCEAGLAQTIGLIWFRSCRNSAHLGSGAWYAWRHSPLASGYRPMYGEFVGFIGSVVLGRLVRSRRKRQGMLRQ